MFSTSFLSSNSSPLLRLTSLRCILSCLFYLKCITVFLFRVVNRLSQKLLPGIRIAPFGKETKKCVPHTLISGFFPTQSTNILPFYVPFIFILFKPPRTTRVKILPPKTRVSGAFGREFMEGGSKRRKSS